LNQDILQIAISQVMPAARATGLFVSRASFTKAPDTQGPTGNPTDDWQPVSGMQDLPCMDAPEKLFSPSATEARNMAEILSESYRHVLMDRYYANLVNASENGWRAIIDGVEYDILSTEADSQRTQTRIRLQRVEF